MEASASGDDGLGSGVGSIDISGGTEPYTVYWFVLSTMETADSENLTAGEYLAVVIDSIGCKVSQEVTVEDVSAVDGMNQMPFTLSPNPTRGIIQIYDMETGLKSIDVMHSSGQHAMNQSSVTNASIDLDLSALSPGLYLIRVQSATSTQLRRVILTN